MDVNKTVQIGSREVGDGQPPYVIAEIGSNHNGDMKLCFELIDAAVEAGCDAVKMQSWSKHTLISKAEYKRNTDYADTHRHFGSLEQMVEKYQLSDAQHREVVEYCADKSVHFFSSAFSPREVKLLDDLDVPCIKLASMDINNLRLLEIAAKTGRPLIISTGMASLAEIERALQTLDAHGAKSVIVLHCISIYPPEYEDIHLNNIPMLRQTFGRVVGFSDHSIGTSIPLAAIALGAAVIEKHFTIDTEMEGWDHWISATPDQMKVIVEQGGHIQRALGSYQRTVSQAEVSKREKFRRRVVLQGDLPEGHVIRDEDVDFKRPGNGIHPDELPYVVGRRLKRAVSDDHELEWSDLS